MTNQITSGRRARKASLSVCLVGLGMWSVLIMGPAASQGPTDTVRVDSSALGPAVAAAPAQVSSGLPQRALVPRTLEAYWPVFAGFAVTWLGIIAYALTFGRRMRRVAAAIEQVDGAG